MPQRLPAISADIMLRDSAHIQMFEAEVEEPESQAERSAGICTSLYHGGCFRCDPAICRVRLSQDYPTGGRDQGKVYRCWPSFRVVKHEIWITEDGEERKLVFSGDIGNTDQPLLKTRNIWKPETMWLWNPHTETEAMGKRPDYIAELTDIIRKTFRRGGPT